MISRLLYLSVESEGRSERKFITQKILIEKGDLGEARIIVSLEFQECHSSRAKANDLWGCRHRKDYRVLGIGIGDLGQQFYIPAILVCTRKIEEKVSDSSYPEP